MSETSVVPATSARATLAAFMVAPEQQQPLSTGGEELTVLASGAQTGSYEIFRQVGPEGSGPPPHTHPWDESFYVIRGEIHFSIDDHEQTAQPGTLVHLPAGTKHWFRFAAGGGEMLSITSREAASRLFVDLAREVPPDDPDMAKFSEVAARYGAEILV